MKYAKGSFITVPSAGLKGIGSGAQAVYLWLCDFSNRTGECFPSKGVLSELVGCSERSLDAYMEDLINAGLVIKEDRFIENRQTSNNYYLPVVDHGGVQILRGEGAESAGGEGAESAHRTQPIEELNTEKAETFVSDSSEEDVEFNYDIDSDGEEFTRKVKKTPRERKDTTALRIVHVFQDRVREINPSVEVQVTKGYLLALTAMKSLTEPQIYNLFDDWFADTPDVDAVNIGGALSTFNINRFKVKEGI